jgi:hypothetical protein
MNTQPTFEKAKSAPAVQEGQTKGEPGLTAESMPTNSAPIPGLSISDNRMIYRGVPVREMMAYPIPLFAKLIGRSRQYVWKEITLGRLRVKNRLISRAEAEHWLSPEES